MAGDEKPTEKLLSAKLMVDRSSYRVIFAEAGKDVVDFLFGLLQMPLVSLIRAAAPGCFPCSTNNFYESLKTLDSSFIKPTQAKDSLLNSRTVSPANASLLGPNWLPAATQDVKYFTCPQKNCKSWYSSVYGRPCPYCCVGMTVEMQQTGSKLVVQNVGEGHVKESVTYMMADDLRITPMSGAISVVLLLTEMQVRDVGLLEQREVSIGNSEGLELLMTSLQSKTVLTDVFLKKEKEEEKEKKEREKSSTSKKTSEVEFEFEF